MEPPTSVAVTNCPSSSCFSPRLAAVKESGHELSGAIGFHFRQVKVWLNCGPVVMNDLVRLRLWLGRSRPCKHRSPDNLAPMTA